MLYLLLSIACSLAIGMIFKVAGRAKLDRFALLTVNYVAALVTALWFSRQGGSGGAIDGGVLLLAAVAGALFILGFFLLALATDVAGMSLAIGVMRVSVVIPFLLSWWVWDEAPTPYQMAGLAVAGAAFFLIAHRGSGGADAAGRAGGADAGTDAPRVGRAVIVLALLFLVGGLVDTSMKAFDEWYAPEIARSRYLAGVFGVAAVLGGCGVLVRGLRSGSWPGWSALPWGVTLGVVNYGATFFLLRAVKELSGPFVFPVNNIAVVMGGALLGVFVWGEALSRRNRVGLLLAAVALALLSVRS